MLHLEMDLDGIVDPVTPRAFTPGDAMGGMQPHSDCVPSFRADLKTSSTELRKTK